MTNVHLWPLLSECWSENVLELFPSGRSLVKSACILPSSSCPPSPPPHSCSPPLLHTLLALHHLVTIRMSLVTSSSKAGPRLESIHLWTVEGQTMEWIRFPALILQTEYDKSVFLTVSHQFFLHSFCDYEWAQLCRRHHAGLSFPLDVEHLPHLLQGTVKVKWGKVGVFRWQNRKYAIRDLEHFISNWILSLKDSFVM